ncbi:MAG: leucyl aminopeptidase family protein [Rhodospirillales bacterium]|nr:leucyl aminopeptidase family protein [Rhodospirillales bacterium]
MPECLIDGAVGGVPIQVLHSGAAADPVLLPQARWRRWAEANGFEGKAGQVCLLPDVDGGLECVVFAYDPVEAPWCFAGLAAALPDGCYRLRGGLDPRTEGQCALGWLLAGYRFERYKAAEPGGAQLVWPAGCERAEVERLAGAVALVRDLINTPAEDMGPSALGGIAEDLGRTYGAEVTSWVGKDLLDGNFPMVHTVGRAAEDPPRLVALRWGSAGPHLALVGKGVCFDSGGLDIKTAEGMKLMKKDMGGAAHALGLARLIMDARLLLRLTLVLPIVENAIAGNAFRPLDVLTARDGSSVEVGNTDAEGRLILADAIAYACESKPDLLIDFATLTGAARVALGTEVPALFTNDDWVAERWQAFGIKEKDPVWRLPLHRDYRRHLDSNIADIHSTGEDSFGGAITAALFLQHFLPEEQAWAHLDLMAWNRSARPGRPLGGEAMGLRAAYAMIKQWCEKKTGG